MHPLTKNYMDACEEVANIEAELAAHSQLTDAPGNPKYWLIESRLEYAKEQRSTLAKRMREHQLLVPDPEREVVGS